MLCASCKHPLPSSETSPTSEQQQALLKLLKSSSIPVERSRYSADIASLTPLLAQYDDEIHRAEETLASLRTNRRQIQEYVDGCRAAIAPVRRLPPELLVKIFEPVASPGPSYDAQEEWHNLIKRNLLRVARVCTYWYGVAMCTPTLWSDIYLKTFYWQRRQLQLYLRALRTCFERAMGAPLTISMHLSPPSPALVELLVEYCHSWQSLSLRSDTGNFKALEGLKGKLQALEMLSLDLYHDGSTSIDDVDIFEDAPKLKHVHFETDHTTKVHDFPKLPWSQLQSFTSSDSGAGEYTTIHAMENLSRGATFRLLRLRGEGHYILPLEITPITSAISTFSVEVADYAWTPARALSSSGILGAVLDCLTLSSLQTLGIRVMDSTPVFWPEDFSFERFFGRSSLRGTLQCLDLSGVCVTDEQLLHAIAPLAFLERLEISDWPALVSDDGEEEEPVVVLSDLLLRRLTSQAHDPQADVSHAMIPHLKQFICRSSFAFSPRIYHDFVASRIALIDVPFENTLSRVSGVDAKLLHGVVNTLRPLVAKQKLRVFYPPSKVGELAEEN